MFRRKNKTFQGVGPKRLQELLGRVALLDFLLAVGAFGVAYLLLSILLDGFFRPANTGLYVSQAVLDFFWVNPLRGMVLLAAMGFGAVAATSLILSAPTFPKLRTDGVNAFGALLIRRIFLLAAFVEFPYLLLASLLDWPFTWDLVAYGVLLFAIVSVMAYLFWTRKKLRFMSVLTIALLPILGGLAPAAKSSANFMDLIPVRGANEWLTSVAPQQAERLRRLGERIKNRWFRPASSAANACAEKAALCLPTAIGHVGLLATFEQRWIGNNATRRYFEKRGYKTYFLSASDESLNGVYVLATDKGVLDMAAVKEVGAASVEMTDEWVAARLAACATETCEIALGFWRSEAVPKTRLLIDHDLTAPFSRAAQLDETGVEIYTYVLQARAEINQALAHYCAHEGTTYCAVKPIYRWILWVQDRLDAMRGDDSLEVG
jgi:hypothetical protein